jgi:hypothetical protein
VRVQRETLSLTVSIDAGSSTVPVNRTTDGPFKISKVVTIAQRLGRLSNIHGRRLLSFLPRNQADHHADFHLTDGCSAIKIVTQTAGHLLIYQILNACSGVAYEANHDSLSCTMRLN